MYLNMWPLGRKHNTLAIMGCVQPLGAIVPVTDMQAQWAVRVFKVSFTVTNTKLRERLNCKLFLLHSSILLGHLYVLG